MTSSFAYSGACIEESPMWAFEIKSSLAPSTSTLVKDALLERNKWFAQKVEDALKEESEFSAPVDETAIKNLPRFLRLLPDDMPLSGVCVTSAGSICFDWDDNLDCQLSILLQEENKISFAGYFTGDQIHGTANFTNMALPEELVAATKRWLRYSTQ